MRLSSPSSTSHRALAVLLAGALLLPTLAQASRVVHCESRHHMYNRCEVDTGGRVSIERQTSYTACREGQNWGYDHRSIWVDRGCGADFRVGGSDRNKAIAVGAAVVGLAALAAMASRSDNHSADTAAWAVGSFRGYDEFERTNVELNIVPGGSLTGRAGTHDFTGHLSGSELQAGRTRFRIERSGNGFIATDVNNAGHRVAFVRTGGGY
jgi:hypothetical protein